MLSESVKQTLLSNWGSNAEAMNCYAEVKFIDTETDWACYVFGLNPDDMDEIACLIDGYSVEACNWSLKELYQRYNTSGEYPILDPEFRRIRAAELFKRLGGK